MYYEGDIYRPPSEAHSLLVQVTIGCAWNKCTFCYMYRDKKFRIRSLEDIDKDLVEGSRYAGRIRRIFLCDGDAMAMPTDKMTAILTRIQELYPKLESVRVYAAAKDVRRKTVDELKQMKALGMDMVYLGLESGDDEILKAINKGEDSASMIEAAKLLHAAGVKQSVSIISGLGRETRWREHMTETARVLNAMQPEYVGLLAMMPPTEAGYEDLTEGGPLHAPDQLQTLEEMRLLVEKLELEDCLFSSAHASNYNHVRGHLPEDKDRLLKQIDGSIEMVKKGGGMGHAIRRL